MNRNTVALCVLIGLLFLAFFGFGALATAVDQPSKVTCTSTAYSTVCERS